ncbi:ABC transporter substrate-binding protein [Kineococcus gynurae]|uniref:ABC transporter substrate-binding protein n=1 Tax=Kineococcus gynurae TaxID=452979 RepID=A0ABV5LMQ3_9ACTN
MSTLPTRSARPSRRTVLTAGSLSLAGGALGLSACAPPPSYELVSPAGAVDTTDGLLIDGELVADAALFAAAREEGRVSLYTGYVENSEKEVVKAFTADTGIAVEMIRLVPNRLLERVLSEQGAGRLGADVVRSSDPANVERMFAAGVFTPHVVPGFDELDDTVRYEGGSYYRCFDPAFTFGYNTALVDEADRPTSWHDLVDPRWKGRLGITQAGAGGSSLSLTRFQLEVLGPEWLEALAANEPRIFDSSGAMQESLARGEIDVSTAVVSSLNISMAKNAPVQFVVPEEGFALYDYFVGVAGSASHPNAAQVFLNWNMSRRGGSVFADIGEYSTNPEADPPTVHGTVLPAVSTGLPHRPAPEDLAAHQKSDQEFWNSAFGYIG